MKKKAFARIKVRVKRGIVEVMGQNRTMRGVIYNRQVVSIPIEKEDRESLKKANADGVKKLYEDLENA